jgi:DNA-binding transcriptional ArsR family regulator
MTKGSSEGCTPYLKALVDDTRRRIVRELLSHPSTVNELAERLKVSQYNISKHLRVLREAGIVRATRQGKHVQSRIAPDFQRRNAGKANQLDLGCCLFRFDKNQPGSDAKP